MTILLVCLTPAVLADEANVRGQYPPARGELLYRNHCNGCHQADIHARGTRVAKSTSAVETLVRRWSEEISLNWDDEDIAAVTRYLVHRYYKYDAVSSLD